MITRCARPSRRFVAPALGAAALLCLSGAAAGSNIDPTAYGHQLAGGLLTVTWVPGPGGASISTSAPIFASGPDAGAALLPDPFGGSYGIKDGLDQGRVRFSTGILGFDRGWRARVGPKNYQADKN